MGEVGLAVEHFRNSSLVVGGLISRQWKNKHSSSGLPSWLLMNREDAGTSLSQL